MAICLVVNYRLGGAIIHVHCQKTLNYFGDRSLIMMILDEVKRELPIEELIENLKLTYKEPDRKPL